MGNALTDTSRPLKINNAYDAVFGGTQRINLCVVRANAASGTGLVVSYTPTLFSSPSTSIIIAFGRSYNSLSSAVDDLRRENNPYRNVILIVGTIELNNQTINILPDTVIAGYNNFINPPEVGTITGNRGALVFNNGAFVNMNIRNNISLRLNLNRGGGVFGFGTNDQFSFAGCTLNLSVPIQITLLNRASAYFIDCDIRGPSPLFDAIKEGVNNSNIYFAYSSIHLEGENQSALIRTTFASGATAKIDINFRRTYYAGNIVATDFIIARFENMEIEENRTNNIGINAYWYNNIIVFDEDKLGIEVDYLAKPLSPEEHASNYLINAVLVNKGEIDNSKFVKYSYITPNACVITNSKEEDIE